MIRAPLIRSVHSLRSLPCLRRPRPRNVLLHSTGFTPFSSSTANHSPPCPRILTRSTWTPLMSSPSEPPSPPPVHSQLDDDASIAHARAPRSWSSPTLSSSDAARIRACSSLQPRLRWTVAIFPTAGSVWWTVHGGCADGASYRAWHCAGTQEGLQAEEEGSQL